MQIGAAAAIALRRSVLGARCSVLGARCSVLGRKQKRDSSTNRDVNLDIGASEKSAMRKTQRGERRS
ncbi:hypothetical protein FOC34_01645 [Burkholderia multivorans]|uniref:hypothetical protein n=1 Tax=Burkholderia multivorans TaxID=87883 RepID=UPI0012DFE2E6|nr:hypothetical protein FOC34_01645 [Burkholderia multivorans]